MATVTGMLALAAGYTSLLVSEREQNLVQDSAYNSVFGASQAATELMGLEAQVGRYGLKPTPTAKDDVQLRLAIMDNRLDVLSHGEIGAFIATDPIASEARARLADAVETARPLIEAIDQTGNPQKILDVFRPLQGPVAMLVGSVNNTASLLLGAQEAQIAKLHRIGLCLTFGLIGCGLVLVLMLVRRSARIHTLAYTDPLTGLPNRLSFQARLAALMAGAEYGDELAIMLLDLDMFKNVNDVLGHAAGDSLLLSLAKRLELLLKNVCLVSRLGGDEFAVLLSVHDARSKAADLAERICGVVAEPFEIEGKSILVGISVGIMVASSTTSDPETLFKNADAALYAAKAAGRGTYRFFDPKMENALRRRREMEADLRVAIQNGGLELYFQPIVDLATLSVISCEALARWNDPKRGFVPPSEFIPLAEESGLIVPLGAWVIRQACAVAKTWPDTVRVSINLSSHQFDRSGLVEAIAEALDGSGLSADRVEFEITESVFLQDHTHVLQTLSALKRMGARIALDDFGTGYSSIGYLQRFPIDKIKIDQSFVREITRSQDSALIVEAIGTLARKLGVTTTAEGIETELHAALIKSMGYTEGQGYFFGRPMTPEACLDSLKAQADRPQPVRVAAA